MFKRFILPLAILTLSAGFSAPLTAGQSDSSSTSSTGKNTSYQQALDKMQAKSQPAKPSRISAEERAAMKAFNQQLAATMPNPGIAVGQLAPDFSLNNAFGETLTLSEELKKGPVVLVFYRGAWCPYCNLHLHVLQNAKPQLDALNARLIAVSPQKPERTKVDNKDDGFVRYVLSDSRSKVMQDYRLYFELPEHMVAIYKKMGLSLEHYNGTGRNVLPVPGTFVIDPSGKVVAMQAQTDYKKRMEPDDIIKALKAIK